MTSRVPCISIYLFGCSVWCHSNGNNIPNHLAHTVHTTALVITVQLQVRSSHKFAGLAFTMLSLLAHGRGKLSLLLEHAACAAAFP